MSDETTDAMNEQPRAACGRCGEPDAAKFGDEFICDDCYSECGACCAGDEESSSEI